MRAPRIIRKGATYHIVSQTNHKEFLLTKEERKRFLIIIRRAKRKFRFTLEAFTVMGTHFHMVITPLEDANLSKILQWIKGVFAQDYNRRHNLTGHFWAGRFKSRIVEGINALIRVIKYVEDNPVKAGLVDRAQDWTSGSAYHRSLGFYGLVTPYPME